MVGLIGWHFVSFLSGICMIYFSIHNNCFHSSKAHQFQLISLVSWNSAPLRGSFGSPHFLRKVLKQQNLFVIIKILLYNLSTMRVVFHSLFSCIKVSVVMCLSLIFCAVPLSGKYWYRVPISMIFSLCSSRHLRLSWSCFWTRVFSALSRVW